MAYTLVSANQPHGIEPFLVILGDYSTKNIETKFFAMRACFEFFLSFSFPFGCCSHFCYVTYLLLIICIIQCTMGKKPSKTFTKHNHYECVISRMSTLAQ